MTLGEESIAFVRFACVAAAFCLPRSEHLAGSLNTQAKSLELRPARESPKGRPTENAVHANRTKRAVWKGHDKRGDHDQGEHYYNHHDQEAFHGWYVQHEDHLPPGLARKDHLPPGLFLYVLRVTIVFGCRSESCVGTPA
jgi:hypothetical protein